MGDGGGHTRFASARRRKIRFNCVQIWMGTMRHQQPIQAVGIMIKRRDAVPGSEKRCNHRTSNAASSASNKDNTGCCSIHGILSC